MCAHVFSSVAQSCLTFCNPMDCSTPGFPVHHQLPELKLMSIESVMPSSHLILCCPLLLLPPIPPSIKILSNETTLRMSSQSIGVSVSASVLPKNIQDWSPLEWTGWISLQSKGLEESSSTPQFKSINSSVLSFLHSPTFTFINVSKWSYQYFS